jgi:hypothetical protein
MNYLDFAKKTYRWALLAEWQSVDLNIKRLLTGNPSFLSGSRISQGKNMKR